MNIHDNPQITVIDDFYPSLDWVAPYLTSSSGMKNIEANYAGLVYPAPKDQTSFALTKIKTLGLPEEVEVVEGQGELRLATAEDTNQYKYLIHADHSFNVLVYLSGQKAGNTGTVFYQHRDLKLMRVPDDPHQAAKMAILFEHDSRYPERWDIVREIEFRPNRAIMFDGRYFHSVPSVFFGKGIEHGRVTQNFFFPYKKNHEKRV